MKGRKIPSVWQDRWESKVCFERLVTLVPTTSDGRKRSFSTAKVGIFFGFAYSARIKSFANL